MKERKKVIFQWLLDEEAFSTEGNVHYAERAFFANSAISWLEKQKKTNNLNDDQLERYMKLLHLFLQKKLDLFWNKGMINVQTKNNKKGEQFYDPGSSMENKNRR